MGTYDGAMKQTDAVILGSFIHEIDEIEQNGWEGTTRNERYYMKWCRRFAVMLFEQTGYTDGKERDLNGSPKLEGSEEA